MVIVHGGGRGSIGHKNGGGQNSGRSCDSRVSNNSFGSAIDCLAATLEVAMFNSSFCISFTIRFLI